MWLGMLFGLKASMVIAMKTQLGYVDAAGFIYVTGLTCSSFLTVDGITYTHPFTYPMYLIKMDSAGNVVWCRFAGGVGSGGVESRQLVTDNNCNIYVLGGYSVSMATFGSVTLTNSTGGDDNIFLAEYDSSGNVKWAKSGTSINGNICSSLCLDPSGNIIITGTTRSPTINFNGIILNIVGASVNDHIFLVKYDSIGTLIWAKSFGSNNSDESHCVAADKNGIIYLSGKTAASSIAFDTINLTIPTNNTFLVKFTQDGNAYYGRAGICGGKIEIDTAMQVYNENDNFLKKNDSLGNTLWETWYAGNDFDFSTSGIFTVGSFHYPTYIFGSIILVDSNTSYADVFISKLSEPPLSFGSKYFYQNQIIVSPNPSNGKFNLLLPCLFTYAKIAVYDIYGKALYSTIANSDLVVLDLSLLDGVYFLKIFFGNELYTTKILIKN